MKILEMVAVLLIALSGQACEKNISGSGNNDLREVQEVICGPFQ